MFRPESIAFQISKENSIAILIVNIKKKEIKLLKYSYNFLTGASWYGLHILQNKGHS